jgi:hypothetical protein
MGNVHCSIMGDPFRLGERDVSLEEEEWGINGEEQLEDDPELDGLCL